MKELNELQKEAHQIGMSLGFMLNIDFFVTTYCRGYLDAYNEVLLKANEDSEKEIRRLKDKISAIIEDRDKDEVIEPNY